MPKNTTRYGPFLREKPIDVLRAKFQHLLIELDSNNINAYSVLGGYVFAGIQILEKINGEATVGDTVKNIESLMAGLQDDIDGLNGPQKAFAQEILAAFTHLLEFVRKTATGGSRRGFRKSQHKTRRQRKSAKFVGPKK